MASPNPFIYNQPWLAFPFSDLVPVQFVKEFPFSVGICSSGAITGQPGPIQGPPAPGVQDFQTGTMINLTVGMHWTGTCYTGFRSLYLEPTTGAVINLAGFWDNKGTFLGAIPGRQSLFADVPGVKHIGIAINLSYDGSTFPICAVRITDFTVRTSSVINSSGVCFPTWEYVSDRTIHLLPPATYQGPPTGLPPSIIPPGLGPRPPAFWNHTNFGGDYVEALYRDEIFIDQGALVWLGDWTNTPPFTGWFDLVGNTWNWPVFEFVDIDSYPEVTYLQQAVIIGGKIIRYDPLGYYYQPNEEGDSFFDGKYYNFVRPFAILQQFFMGSDIIVPEHPFDDLCKGPYPNPWNASLDFRYSNPNGIFLVDVLTVPPDELLTLELLLSSSYNSVLGQNTIIAPTGSPDSFGFGSTNTVNLIGSLGNFVYNTVPMEPAGYSLYVYNLSADGYYIAPVGG